MSPDLSIYVDVSRQRLVLSEASTQSLDTLQFIEGQVLQVNAEFMDFTNNGLVPYVNIDPTGWTLTCALGYINSAGEPTLISLASTSAVTAISAISGAQTAMTFQLDLATSAAAELLAEVTSSPVWFELAWSQSGVTAFVNKVQTQATILAGYAGEGLTPPT